MSISAVVITYNEESNIEKCLKGLAFADEIVVLDSFSTDKTLEIARRYTDKVAQRKFTGFSDQKNAAVQMASSEWVMIVDADEVVTPELASEIVRAVESESCDVYRMPRLTHFLGKPIRHSGWYPDYVVRLARKSKAKFADRLVHETLELDDKCGTLKHDLIHYSYRDLDDFGRKMISYSRAAARQKCLEGRRFRLSDLVFAPGLTFLKKFVMKQGYRDGIRGFMVSALTACGVFLRYAMLWEMTRHQDPSKE